MFEKNTDRSGTRSYKFSEPAQFGVENAISLGCADFEYDVPRELSQFMQQRAQHQIYGYTQPPSDLKQNIISYYQQRHGILISEAQLLVVPGVLSSIGALLEVYAKDNSKILLLEPEYPPFFKIAQKFNLEVLTSKLIDGNIDYVDLQQKLSQATIFLFSHPHNPTGNSFDIQKISQMCQEANVFLISDEIWADFQLAGKTHLSAFDYGYPALLAPSKTFNMPGIAFSVILWKDELKLKQLGDFFDRLHVGTSGCFSNDAANVVYGKCSYWVDELIKLLKENAAYVKQELSGYKILGGDETALLFIDFSPLFDDSLQCAKYFTEKGVFMQEGNRFYNDNKCPGAWVRMNIGSPKSVIAESVQLIKGAILDLRPTK